MTGGSARSPAAVSNSYSISLTAISFYRKKEIDLGSGYVRSWDDDIRLVLRPDRLLRSALDQLGVLAVLYLTAFVTLAALVYLVYAMLRPERF